MKKEVIAKHMKAGRPVQWLPEINQFVVFRKPIDLVKDAVKVGDGTVRIDIGPKGTQTLLKISILMSVAVIAYRPKEKDSMVST